jgi:hypothetical protein
MVKILSKGGRIMTYSYITSGAPDSPAYSVDLKDGEDGKFEEYGPPGDRKTRLKWNRYRRYVVSQSCTAGYTPDVEPYKTWWPGPWWLGFSNPGFINGNDLVKHQEKFVNKIRGHEFHLAKFTGESPQAYRMIVDNVVAIGMAGADVSRGHFDRAARRLRTRFDTNAVLGAFSSKAKYGNLLRASEARSPLRLKDVSGRYLEATYGWIPLIDDCYEAAKAFEAINNEVRKDLIVKVTKQSFSGQSLMTPSISTATQSWKVDRKIITRHEISEELSVKRSSGLLDPAGTAWELMPWSFVIDWFLPIGTYLDNLNIIPNLKGRTMVTKIVKVTGSASANSPGLPGQLPYTGATINGSLYELSREVYPSGLSAFQVARPQVKTLDDAMSPKHLANALALIHQLISK